MLPSSRIPYSTATAVLVAILVTLAPSPATAQGLDHFMCYKASSNGAKFAPRTVHLEDQAHDADAEVKKQQFVCAPASKNGEQPAAPTHPLHLEDYKIKTAVKFQKLENQRVVDQFGTHFLDLRKPVSLQVPSNKSLANPPAPPAPNAIDHFQCYLVKETRGTAKFAKQIVTVEDQFGSMSVELKKPKRLCLPVDKNGEAPGAGDHDARLLCYQAKQTSEPKFAEVKPVYTTNQFGFENLRVKKPAELCVPAAMPPPNCGNGVVDPGEECDGDAPSPCPGTCRPVCQCASCGDGQVNQPNEECDGAAAPTCPGFCQPHCGCPGTCDPLDTSVCLHPFPNDYFTILDPSTDTGRRVHLSVLAMPRNAANVPINPVDHNRNDGFSPGNSIDLRVPQVDLAVTDAPPITDMARSLDADSPTVIVNATTLAHHLHWAEIDSNASSEATRALFLRPGINFDDGERYIVALRNMKRSDGSLIAPSAAFLAYRDAIPTADPAIEARRPHMESIFATLAAAGVPRGDLYLAWDFTVASTRNITERMLFLRDDGFSRLGAAAPTFAVTSVTNDVDANIFRTVEGTYTVERYVSTPLPGSRFILDANGIPIRQPSPQTAGFVCHIPRAALANAAATAVPARASIYGHGLLGSRTEVGAGNVRAMSNEHNFVFCATDWIGMSNADVPNAIATLQDLSNFPSVTDRLQQGFLNQLFLARLMIHPQGFTAHTAFQDLSANSVLDTSDVFFDGNSQGGIFGATVMAIAQDITRGVLGVPGMNYSTLLTRSTDWAVFASFMYPAYPNELERPLIFSLIQMLWDRSDPNGYAAHITGTRAPLLPNTPAHKVLLHEAFGDFQVANVATEVETRTLGAHVYQPALAPGRHTDVTPFLGIPAIPSFPFDGSALVVWDSGTAAPPTTNTPPGPGTDPHGKPRSNVSARVQKSEFLKTNGAVVDVCGGAPCLAP